MYAISLLADVQANIHIVRSICLIYFLTAVLFICVVTTVVAVVTEPLGRNTPLLVTHVAVTYCN